MERQSKTGLGSFDYKNNELYYPHTTSVLFYYLLKVSVYENYIRKKSNVPHI